MGYTHYFPQSETVSPSVWDRFIEDTKKVFAEADKQAIPIAREYDQLDKPPLADDGFVMFNGVGANGHETFVLPRVLQLYDRNTDGTRFHFCKTARKPYDAVVVAVLCLALEHMPTAFSIGSDGYVDDWFEGLELANTSCGRCLEISLMDNFEDHPDEEEAY